MIRVYQVTCLIDGKRYIGVTRKTLVERWKQHKAKCSTDKVRYLHRAIRKHGAESFRMEEVCLCLSPEIAAEVEQKLIKERKTRAPKGYNLTSGGDVGSTHSESTKRKLRRIKLGKKMSATARTNMSKAQKGRKHSAATKAKMSAWHKGKVVSKATRKKMSRNMKAYWDRHRQSVVDYMKRLQSRRVAS